jgi:hypothetical protein
LTFTFEVLSVVSFRFAELRFVSYCPVVTLGLPDCAQIGEMAAANVKVRYLNESRAMELEELVYIRGQLENLEPINYPFTAYSPERYSGVQPDSQMSQLKE